ncbi:MAG: acyltransferase [Oscillospiraceae bacterium]|nr:acyltransferase [Oscillospiraceae bacterium]
MKARSYGIDLLKSMSMLMVAVLHVLGVGGLLNGSAPGSAANNAAWILETACICAVNCFGLISGYVLCRGRYRRSRLLSLWLRVVFESLVITAVFAVFKTGSVGTKEWIKAFMPVIHNVYWYFTAYFALFFFVPYINKMLLSLSGKEKASLAVSIVLVFSLLGNVLNNDIFFLNGGYGFLWLLCLYILGACMRSIEIRPELNKYWFLMAYLLCTLLSWAAMKLTGIRAFISYTSPFTLLSAALLLLFFRRLEISSPKLQKFISMLARTSFGVYIIHTHPLIWTYLLTDRFTPYLKYPWPTMLGAAILTAAAVYAVCTLGDWLAEKFFKLVRVDILERAVDSIGKNRRKTQITTQK